MDKSKWRERLEVIKIEAPWWQSAGVRAVATVRLGQSMAWHVHVIEGRGLGGNAYVALPATKRDSGWAPVIELLDADLREAVAEVVLAAYAAWQPVRV